MCIICVDFQKQLISADEARLNMREMSIDPQHRIKMEMMLDEDDD